MNSAQVAGGDRNRVIIVADDYQFLDTLYGVVVSYEWLLANTRERLLELTEIPPLAVVIDLQMQSMDPLRVLELVGSLKLPGKIFLLQGGDMRVLAKAKSLGAGLTLNIGGILSRPLMLGNLVTLLAPHAQSREGIAPQELETAIRERQLLLHYQPMIRREGKGWAIRGAEALVRWQHPQRGLLYPGQFLRLAEGSGQMPALTDFVMMEAIRQAGAWERQGAELAVSINLAPSQVHSMEFLDRLLGLTREHGVSPNRLTIEVIEAASLKDRDFLKEVFMRLRLQGIGLSLDDFGTGYSSLTELYRLPFTDVKIDRTLIADVPQSREASTIVSGIVELAHRLSMHVCAEGVESTEGFLFLEEAGCDAIQGVLIAKPSTVAEFDELREHWSERRLPGALPE